MTSHKMWKGSRITGPEGNKLLSYFIKEADNLAINDIPELNNTNVFQPQFSHPQTYSHLKELIHSPKLILEDKEVLLSRRESFSREKSKSLELISPGDNDLTVMTPNSDSFYEFIEELKVSVDLLSSDPNWESRINILVNEIIPIEPTSENIKMRKDGSGLSTHFYRKGVFLSRPMVDETRAFELALNLTHEMGHQALMAYEVLDDIIQGGPEVQSFSPIRQTSRPAIQSLHAVIAIVYMLEFIYAFERKLLQIIGPDYLNKRKAELKKGLKEGLYSLEDISMTKLGNQIVSELQAFSLFFDE